MRKKFDWFVPGMAVAVFLAWLFPTPGARGGWMHPELLTKVGVAAIFFLHGVALSFSALKAGASRWKLHLVVQLCTFLLFPLLGLAALAIGSKWIPPDLRLGVFYLCALPSTVSSSVAMTAAARGDIASAVFNATLSSLIGVLLTPLWMGWFAGTTGDSLPLGQVILDLTYWLLLPLAAGQISRRWLAAWAHRNKSRINTFDKLTILLLAYTSFCDSFVNGVWTGNGSIALWTLLGSLVLFWTVMLTTGWVCDLLKFPTEQRIAAVFCGSKKTLASGIPMAQLMFASHQGIAMILLPIMVYHPLQLVICGALASRWAKRPE